MALAPPSGQNTWGAKMHSIAQGIGMVKSGIDLGATAFAVGRFALRHGPTIARAASRTGEL